MGISESSRDEYSGTHVVGVAAAGPPFSTFSKSSKSSSGMSHFDSFVSVCEPRQSGFTCIAEHAHGSSTFCHPRSIPSISWSTKLSVSRSAPILSKGNVRTSNGVLRSSHESKHCSQAQMREHTVRLLPDAFPCPGVKPVRTSLRIPVLSLLYISRVLGAHIAQHTQTFILAVGLCRRRLWRRDGSCEQVEWNMWRRPRSTSIGVCSL